MKKFILLCSVTLLGSLLSGCITTRNTGPIEPITYFSSPAISTNTATIIGSTAISQSIKADKIAYVFAVDFKKIEKGRAQMNSQLAIEAGEHDLQLWCQQGGFKYTNLTRVKLEAGKHYQVGFDMNVNKQYNCYMWIYDLDAKKAIGELIPTIEVGEYANPDKIHPITQFLEARPNTQSNVTIPISVINKMGHN
ncbi:hypothetical protein [Acinetobacter seifertii]|uniref:hypothetical protein n=1 Tax=Acinetobacter seifertii TaxID=1530123 RepID=UPI000D34B3C4|nr:hypothetical protein [Acinetobacter seifertii]PTV52126.1 hypothetical protein DBL04_15215 [Acinetobacter seifertii]